MAGRIRICHTSEYEDEILLVDRECFPTLDDAPPVAITEDSECWVALDEQGFVVGYLVGEQVDGEAYLSRYGVLAKVSGQGIGRRLVRAWLRWAANEGMKAAWTYTYSHNASSINALVAAGFRAWAPGYWPFNGGAQSERHCLWRKSLK